MWGAIIGDLAGSVYEYGQIKKIKTVEVQEIIPENAFFMMGDQRETSIDSRSSVIGCISADHTIGKILCKFWPISEFKWLG